MSIHKWWVASWTEGGKVWVGSDTIYRHSLTIQHPTMKKIPTIQICKLKLQLKYHKKFHNLNKKKFFFLSKLSLNLNSIFFRWNWILYFCSSPHNFMFFIHFHLIENYLWKSFYFFYLKRIVLCEKFFDDELFIVGVWLWNNWLKWEVWNK